MFKAGALLVSYNPIDKQVLRFMRFIDITETYFEATIITPSVGWPEPFRPGYSCGGWAIRFYKLKEPKYKRKLPEWF